MRIRWFFLMTGLSIIVRLAVMPITAHGDLFYIWSVPTLAVEGVWQPYSWASQNYLQVKDSDFDVYYPPLTYMATGSWLIVLSKISATLVPWLAAARDKILSLTPLTTLDYLELAAAENIEWNIFLLKTFYLLVETGVVFLIWKLAPKEFRRKAVMLWLVNPVVIYSAYMMGQIDLLTSLLVVWATLMAVKGKRLVSLTLLVIGIMAKVLPIVLVAPMVFLLGKSWRERVWLAVYSILIFVVFNLPFSHDLARLRIAYFPPIMPGLADLSFRPDALVMIGKLIAVVGVGLWLAGRVVRNGTNIDPKYFPEIVGLILLLFFSAYRGALFNHYVVLMPFLILFWVKERHVVLKITVFSGLLFLTHIYTRPLQGELFMPLGVDWLTNFKSSRELVAPWFKYEHLSLLTGAVLSGWMLVEAILRGKKIFNNIS